MPDSPYTSMFGGADSTGLMGSLIDTPQLRRMRAFDALGGLGAALIKASAPSAVPRSLTDTFAEGLAGAQQGVAGNEDKYLKRALVASQVATADANLKRQQEWSKILQGAQAPVAAGVSQPGYAASTTPLVGTPEQNAIGTNETGGQDNPYATIGPQTKYQDGTVDQPHGKYGVMGKNIGPWTQEVLGKAMTPQEFLASPQAQDAVFNVKFHQFTQQTGSPQGAATMWFTGRPPGPTNTAPDVLGTTPAQYVQKFNQNYQPNQPPQGQQAPQMAQGGQPPGIPSPLPQPGQAPPAMPPGSQTLQDVIQKIPPGVRQLMGAMDMKEGLPLLMKYAEPNHQIAMDSRTGQVIFADKNDIGRLPFLVPVDAAKLQVEQQKLATEQRKVSMQERNQDVILGPDGQPMVNPQVAQAKKAVAAATGSDVAGHADKVMIDQAVKEHGDLQTNALQARTGIAQTNRLSSLLDQVGTGRFTTTTQEIKQMAKGVGIDLKALGVQDDTAPAQAADALVKQMALSLRNPSQGAGMPGAMSDQDRNFLAKMVPSLETTPEGRKLMMQYAQKMYQRSIETARISNEYIRSGKIKTDPAGMYAEIQKYADEHPMFTEKDIPAAAQGGSIPAPPAGYRMVP